MHRADVKEPYGTAGVGVSLQEKGNDNYFFSLKDPEETMWSLLQPRNYLETAFVLLNKMWPGALFLPSGYIYITWP